MSEMMENDRIRYAGSGSAVPGNTPFGFYDNDAIFVRDCYSSMKWAAERLGYPSVDLEIPDVIFYAAYEESVNEYASIVNQWNIVNNISNFIGSSRTENQQGLNGMAVTGAPIPYLVELANSYGSEIGIGGYVDTKKGFIDTQPRQQIYDLQALWGDVSESFNRIEIRRIYHDRPAAAARIYDPFSMTGMSYSNIFNELGFGSYSPAVQFLCTPIFEDMLRIQAIQFNDMVRKSAFSFELKNNKIKLFPIPVDGFRMWFEYVLKKDKNNSMIASGNPYDNISDFSDIPYNNPIYAYINSPGKQWIKKYFLACCKETLGIVRQKYLQIPIPNGEITLDGAELRSEAKDEKLKLIEDLHKMLERTSKTAQAEAKATEAEKLNQVMKYIPNCIYIG
jgi:hypothetical protein